MSRVDGVGKGTKVLVQTSRPGAQWQGVARRGAAGGVGGGGGGSGTDGVRLPKGLCRACHSQLIKTPPLPIASMCVPCALG